MYDSFRFTHQEVGEKSDLLSENFSTNENWKSLVSTRGDDDHPTSEIMWSKILQIFENGDQTGSN